MGLQRKNILNMGNGTSPYYSGGYPGEDTGPGVALLLGPILLCPALLLLPTGTPTLTRV